MNFFAGLLGLAALGLTGVALVCLVYPLAPLHMGTRLRALMGLLLGVALMLTSYGLSVLAQRHGGSWSNVGLTG